MRQDPWAWNRNNTYPKRMLDCYYCGGIKPEHDEGCIWVDSQALLRVARAAKKYEGYPGSHRQGVIQERIDIWKEYLEALKEVEHLLE